MIIDYINNSSKYDCISENIAKALTFLRATDLKALGKGRYEISGDELFYIVDNYKTKSTADGMLEAHKKYVDVQVVISGSEYIEYESLSDQAVIQEYDEAKDYALYKGEPTFFKLEQDLFVIFFPNDLHMPGINKQKNDVKKHVLKVKI